MRIVLCIGLAMLLAGPVALAQGPSGAAAPVGATAEQDFFGVANAAAGLMRRLMAQPPTPAAEAPLLRESLALCQRGRQVTPAYAQWLRSLPAAQLRPAVERFRHTDFVQYFARLQHDPQFMARCQRSSGAADVVLALLNALDVERPAPTP